MRMVNIEETGKKLKEQLDKLRHEHDVTLPKDIAEAREQGDLRENAGYHAARERMSFIKGKMAQLSQQLAELDSIDLSSVPGDCIGFGSKVQLVDLDTNETVEYTFVSESDIDLKKRQITLVSPVGRALDGKKAGEEVSVEIPAGIKRFRICSILTIHGKELKEEGS